MADLTRKTANLLNIADCNFTINTTLSVTFAKGVITLNGTSGYISSSNAAWKSNFAFYLDAGTYSMNIPTQLGTGYARYIKQYSDDTTLLGASATSFTLAERTQVYFSFYIDSKTLNDTMNFMLVEGTYTSQTMPSFEPYGWVHSLRKQCSATETIQSGDTIYANGQPITTYTLKGNEEHTGTPSPQNPVMPQGTGNKTANLLDLGSWTNQYTTDTRAFFSARFRISGGTYKQLDIKSAGNYKLTLDNLTNETVEFLHNGSTRNILIFSYTANFAEPTNLTVSFYANGYNPTELNGIDLTNIMLNAGSTALPYEPYGFKIPISSGQQTIDIYIGDLPLLKSLDGTAVDEISNGTLTRRVDSDGSVLPTPTTTQITMPSIPTTEGANSITVDTTVQPSEFTATWTGWHDASVKEYDGTDWQ